MRNGSNRLILLVALLAFASTMVPASPDQDELAAVLVFPSVLTRTVPGGDPAETWLTVTNTSLDAIVAHVNFVDGAACLVCDFTVPLAAEQSEVFVVMEDEPGESVIRGTTTGVEVGCAWANGFVVVNVEDGLGNTITDNVLAGEQLVLDYTNGQAHSMRAIAIQGQDGGDGDRNFEFDGVEYAKLPNIVAFEFVAPDAAGPGPSKFDAYVALFTLGFSEGSAPRVDCSVTGFDADGNQFSNSFQFGCWTYQDLGAVDPEFYYPNLGLFSAGDEHGWAAFTCRVDAADDGMFESDGGVHGAIIQQGPAGTQLFGRDGSRTETLGGPAAWGRAVLQSLSTGDSVTLDLD